MIDRFSLSWLTTVGQVRDRLPSPVDADISRAGLHWPRHPSGSLYFESTALAKDHHRQGWE